MQFNLSLSSLVCRKVAGFSEKSAAWRKDQCERRENASFNPLTAKLSRAERNICTLSVFLETFTQYKRSTKIFSRKKGKHFIQL